MSWRDRRPQPQTTDSALLRRLEAAEARLASLEKTGPVSLQLIDIDDYEDDPANINIGDVNVNWPGVHREARRYDPAVYFHDQKWRALGSNAAVYEIKVFEDDEENIVKDRAFVWEFPEDLDGAVVMKAGAFVTTAGGDQEIDIAVDGGGSILDNTITIPAGEKSSRAGRTPQAEHEMAWGGDQLSINTIAASGMGLGVWVLAVGAGVGGVLLQGYKGDPGPVGVPVGNYTPGTTYEPGQIVTNGGSSYIVITNVTNVEPGVDPGWEAVYQLIAGNTKTGSVSMTLHAGSYALIPGIKGAKKMPFAGEITSAELVADFAGDIEVEILKSTYSTWPTMTSIVGSNPLTLSGAIKTTNSTLTGWTTGFAKDDYLIFKLNSVNIISRITVSLEVDRT